MTYPYNRSTTAVKSVYENRPYNDGVLTSYTKDYNSFRLKGIPEEVYYMYYNTVGNLCWTGTITGKHEYRFADKQPIKFTTKIV